MQGIPKSRYVAFIAIAVLGAAVDLWTKHLAFERLGQPAASNHRIHWLWEGYAGFQTSLNEGALFGIGQGLVWLFAVLSVVAFVGILIWLFLGGAARDWLLTISLGCVTAGIFGNLYDRLNLHGLTWLAHHDPAMLGKPAYAVRDFILWQAGDDYRWPNFNVADSLLVCGAALLLWHGFRSPAEHGDDSPRKPAS